MKQNRYLSKPALVALFALIAFFMGNYGLYDIVGLTNESYQVLVSLILALLTTYGVFNNPTDKSNF